jgi:hypothetical protein
VVVAENGAVLHAEGASCALTAPVPAALDEALLRRGIPFRRGLVLLACDGEHDVAVLEELRWLGLDCAIVRNRNQLMVLPAGITKGSGASEALSQLGISRHNAFAIGDAENDLALLDACELSAAVASAVPSLKERADVVLAEPDGSGVASLLAGPLLRDEIRVEPRRWQVDLGRTPQGEAVAIPGSRVNLLVTGGSGSGKSYAAGFFAERLISLGYSVCLFDPEGNHGPLTRLRGVVRVGGREGLPPPARLADILRRGLGSAVVDLSCAGSAGAGYIGDALVTLERLRGDTGVPHWIFVDEAHVPLGLDGVACGFAPARKGFCLVTYRPAELGEVKGVFDFFLAMPGERGIDPGIREALARAADVSPAALDPGLTGVGLGQAVLLRPGPPSELRVFSLAPRWVAHVRHWHKYAGSKLPPGRRFYFRSHPGPSGVVSANLAEFHHEIRRCDADVLRHHAGGLDFSRWIQDVIQDSSLAEMVRSLEGRLGGASPPEVEALRGEFLEAIENRYLG